MESGRLLEEGKQKYPIGEIVTSFSSCNAHRKACSSTAAGQARRRGREKSLARARGKEGEGEESGEERGGELGRGKEGARQRRRRRFRWKERKIRGQARRGRRPVCD